MTSNTSQLTLSVNRSFRAFCQHWLLWANILTGLWVVLPWLAPVLMYIGWTSAAQLIYFAYIPQCHQLPQRSYFLFSDQLMIPLQQILAAYPTDDPLSLRPFIGTPQLGWKVAWSDRMVSLYTPIFLGGLLYALTKRPRPPARLSWSLLWPYVPLAIDGISHAINDALQLQFRNTNDWLAVITGHIFDQAFYQGDQIGSFNWWMRLLTGLLAGFAFVWHVYPHLDQGFAAIVRSTETPEA